MTIAVGLTLVASDLRAEPSGEHGTRLSFVRAANADTCIALPALEREVIRRMGRDPFRGPASQWIEGVVDADDGYYTVQLFERDADGKTLGSRRFRDIAGDCHQLDEAIVLAVALIIDPAADLLPAEAFGDRLAGLNEGPRPEPIVAMPEIARPPARMREAHVDHPLARSAQASGVTRWQSTAPLVTADVVVVHGVLPGFAPGAEWVSRVPIAGADRYGLRLSALYLPEARQNRGGEFGYGLTAFEAGPCTTFPGERWRWFGCAALGVGAIHAVVHHPAPLRPGDRLWLALRIEAGFELRLAGPLSADLRIFDLIAPRRWQFRVRTDDGERAAFTQALLMPGAALGLGLHFQ